MKQITKQITFTFLTMLACISLALAVQQAKLPPLFEQLDLTKEQREKLTPLFAEQTKNIKAVRENVALKDEEKEAKMKDIRREHNKKVNEILTADQRSKLAELRKQQNAQAPPAKPETKKP